MTMLALESRVDVDAGLRAYVALLPLGLRDLGDAIEREAAENPWLEVLERPFTTLDESTLRAVAPDAPSLVAHLEAQLAARSLPADVARAARCVIGVLDEHAYLRDDVATIAPLAGVSHAAAAAGITAAQQLEPTGVAARSLGERFRLQLAADGETASLAYAVAGELEVLATQGASTFAATIGVSARELTGALATLRRCDPDPARDFGYHVDRIYPEIVFERKVDGMIVRTDGRFWPTVQLASLPITPELSDPMKRARTRARLIVDALARRRTTLERLAVALLARQSAYLWANGDVKMLLPLSGRELARDIGCAESTISRAVAARYAATPFGVIPLRSLLARRPGRVDMTTASVRESIREIVTSSPQLSDDAIARALKLRGIRLARRTVAKYRNELGLPTRYERATP